MTDKIEMTLDEAIKHCEEIACNNTNCALEHKQLAEWLKELRQLKSLPEESKCIYNRTLDERKKFCKYCSAACDVRIEEEPETEDLIEEIDKIWKTCNPIDEGMGVETANIHIEQFDDIARHFVEWQKQKDVKRIEKFLYDTGQCGVNVGAGDWLVQQFKDRCL